MRFSTIENSGTVTTKAIVIIPYVIYLMKSDIIDTNNNTTKMFTVALTPFLSISFQCGGGE